MNTTSFSVQKGQPQNMIFPSLKSCLLIVGVLAFGPFVTPHLFAQVVQEAVPGFAVAKPVIVEHVDEAQLATLKGNTRPEARAKNDQGRVASDMRMGDLVLVLRRGAEQQAAFDGFVESQYDSNSPNYHHWLTPEEVGQKFGPAQGDLDSATNWLLNHGFSIDDISRNRLSIRFSGTAAQVEGAFHTEIHNLLVKKKDGSYESHVANMSDPQIPSALTPLVVGVKALHNFFPHPLHRVSGLAHRDAETGKWRHEAASTGSGVKSSLLNGNAADAKPFFNVNDPNNGYLIEDVTPFDFAAIYNVTPLWNASTPIDGSGQTIAIAGTSNIELSDVKTFRSSFGLPVNSAVNTPIVKITNTDPGSTTYALLGDRTENTLDVEWSGAVAKNAQIVLVTSSAVTSTTDPLYLSEDYIIQNKIAPVMNVSYGECELFIGTAGNAEYNTLWQTAASEGIAAFVATGDSGSPSCDQGGDVTNGTPYAAEYGLSVSGLASTPYNTAVGGTDFQWCTNSGLINGTCTASPYWSSSNNSSTMASALGYIPEVPWNDTCASPLGVAFSEFLASSSVTGFGGVSDAETSCNFIIANAQYIYGVYGVDVSGWVDTVGGSGGKSSCTTNNTTSTTTNPSPASCTGGYSKPSWQAGVTGIPSDGKRDIPDISFFASNGFMNSAYLICDTLADNGSGGTVTVPCTYSDTAEDTYQELGGTSASTPAMAGVMALINQKAGAPQGSPNAELYKLAAKESYSSCSSETDSNSSSCVFHDINAGTNAMACDDTDSSPNCSIIHSGDQVGILPGYAATTGYDLATGLGSANVANLVNAFAATATPVPVVTLNSAALTFSSTVVGTAAATQSVTLKNTGTAVLSVSSIKVTGTNLSSFSESPTCGNSVAVSGSCSITVTFKPVATGLLAAAISITDNATGSPQTITLKGTGVEPVVSFSATKLTFLGTLKGSSAASQSVILKNTGTAALSISKVALGGTDPSSFSIVANACGSTLSTGSSCSVTVGFKPAALGALSATLAFTDNAGGSPQAVVLTGTGTDPAVTLSTTAIKFANTLVGKTTASQVVTLRNSGTAGLVVSSIALTGTNPKSFLIASKTCGTILAAGASCAVSVSFKPFKVGALSAGLTFTDDAGGSPQAVSLTGTGTDPAVTLSTTALKFAATLVGSTTASQVVTLKNSGTAGLNLTSIALTGANPKSFLIASKTCGTSLAAGASCTVSVGFKPFKPGALSASLAFTDNASGSPQAVALTGTGTGPAVSLSAASLTFSSTALNTNAPNQKVTVENTGNATLTINSIVIGGTNGSSFNIVSKTCGTSLAAGATCTVTVGFKPTVAGTRTAYLAFRDNTAAGEQAIGLTGMGE